MEAAVRLHEVGCDPRRRAFRRRLGTRAHDAQQIAVDGEPPPGAADAARRAAMRPPAVEVEDRARIGRPPWRSPGRRPGKYPGAVRRDQRVRRSSVPLHATRFASSCESTTLSLSAPGLGPCRPRMRRCVCVVRAGKARAGVRTAFGLGLGLPLATSRSGSLLGRPCAGPAAARTSAPTVDHAALAAGLARLIRVELVRRSLLDEPPSPWRRDLALPLRSIPANPRPRLSPFSFAAMMISLSCGKW